MSNNRYVILNCPTLMGNRLCYSKEIRQCADCTDCVLKQIVELCKGSVRENEHDIYRAGRMSLAINILGLLDIQEVE